MTSDIVNHALLALCVIVAFMILWRLLRVFIYIGIGIAILVSLPYLMHGQVPPWANSVIPWLQQFAQWAWGMLRPILHLSVVIITST